MDKLQPGSPLYNIPIYVPFEGLFDPASLRRALATLVQRHDMLRVHFETVNDQPVQIVESEVPLELPTDDLSGLRGEQQSAALGRLLNEEVQKPFDLTRGVCVRYRLVRLDPGNHLLSVTMHHIVTDAFSVGVFVSELNICYEAYRSGQGLSPLSPVVVEYSDYAQWQRATLRGLRLSKLMNYWIARLSGAPHILKLETDYPRLQDQTFNGTVSGFVFGDELSAAVISLARDLKVTPFMFLLACYSSLLYRYTGQEDILIGVPVANRGHPELESVIGIFVNTLIFRVKFSDSQNFADLLKDVQAATLDAFEYQALPFPKLVEELNVERVPGYPPLYQVVFNFQNASLIEAPNPRPEGETMSSGDSPLVHSNTAKVDLNLTVTQNGARISGGIEYNSDLFHGETIKQMTWHFERIATAVVEDPAIAIMDIMLTYPTAPETLIASSDHHADFMKEGKFSFELND
jgi:hypothetical protein